MMLDDLKRQLTGAKIDDVFVAGFLDVSERPFRFHALYGAVYFECGGGLLRFGVLGYTGRMQITRVDAISFSELELDDDFEPASTSIRQSVLDDPDGSNRLQSLQIWMAEDRPVGIECSAVGMRLSNGQMVFVDPTYHFGIRVGGVTQQTIWLENAPDGDYNYFEIDCL